MIPLAILLLLVGGSLILLFGTFFAKMARLKSRVEDLESREQLTLDLLSQAIIASGGSEDDALLAQFRLLKSRTKSTPSR